MMYNEDMVCGDAAVTHRGGTQQGAFSRMLLSQVAAFRSARIARLGTGDAGAMIVHMNEAIQGEDAPVVAMAIDVYMEGGISAGIGRAGVQVGHDDTGHVGVTDIVEAEALVVSEGKPSTGDLHGTVQDTAMQSTFLYARASSNVEDMTEELRRWRESFTLQDAKNACRSRARSWSMGIFCSGGCLDTIAGIRSGFKPVWSTEIHPGRMRMFEDLTGSPCLGDTFAVDFSKERTPVLLYSGQPCPDYSTSHAGRMPPGHAGATGWQFVAQASKILEVDPAVCVLEMVPNALWLNGGMAVTELVMQLRDRYLVYIELMKVAEHGDASARERLIIVGFHRDKVGAAAKAFAFPKPMYNDMHYHTAINIAVPDADVPDGYWRHDKPRLLPVTQPTPLCMHKIARSGVGMGHSELPSLVQGWDGLLNTQTTHNGGGRRPSLQWQAGQVLDRTRLTVPVETVRAASLPADYLSWCLLFNDGDEGEGGRHLRECVNMGVPVRTACAINECIRIVLLQASVPLDVQEVTLLAAAEDLHLELVAHQATELTSDALMQQNKVRKIRVDTGATSTFMFTDIEPFLEDTTPSNCTIMVAKKDAVLRGNVNGRLRAHVLNLSAYSSLPAHTPFVMQPTTVSELSQELLSVDDYYRHGRYNILLRQPDYQDGVSELYRSPAPGVPEARIPLSYDWQGNGGWWLHYVPAITVDHDDIRLCAAVMQEDVERQSPMMRQRLTRSLMDVDEVAAMHVAMLTNPNVKEVLSRNEADDSTESRSHDDMATGDHDDTVVAGSTKQSKATGVASPQQREQQHMVVATSLHEREILGVKAGMKAHFRRMRRREFHERFMHIGVLPCGEKCRICQMAKGVARRIFTKVDPFKENRVGHTWAMDGITLSHRSSQGCKYLVVLRDIASGAFQLLPLYRKSDVSQAVKDWIENMRRNVIYACLPYPVVSCIRTDNEGSWSLSNAEWTAMLQQLQPTVEMHYVCPDRHAQENGYAESACKIIEITIKQILLAQNLGPEFWQAANVDAQWLLNRFPTMSDEFNDPPDGDKVRPLELLTRGYLSRREIDRQLSYFVAVGTPALVHDHVKGSRLQPKTRWGIAWGMYRDQPTWKCPYTGAVFRSKSYSAYRLRDGLNYFQFLKLPYHKSIRLTCGCRKKQMTMLLLCVSCLR